MKIIDISQEIYSGMPVYPGDPSFQARRVNSFKQGDMCEVSEITMGTHCGTHVDAPLHMLPDGAPLESIPLDCFVGKCRVLTVPYPASVFCFGRIQTANTIATANSILLC